MPLLPITTEKLMDTLPWPDQLLGRYTGVGNSLRLLSRTRTLDDFAGNVHYRTEAFAAVPNDIVSTTTLSKDKFEVKVDVRRFFPEEIYVRTNGYNIIVEGKHGKDYRYRIGGCEFMRTFVIPEGHAINSIVSNLSSTGVLSITVPRISQDADGFWNTSIRKPGGVLKTVKEEDENAEN